MSNILVYDMRLSFIWVETFLDLIGDSVPSEAPLVFLGRRSSYGVRFDIALMTSLAKSSEVKFIVPKDLDLKGLTLPWPEPVGQFFWTYYLEGHTPGYVTGDKAWKALVPFRRKVPIRVSTPWLPGQLILESFFYPHGLAFALTTVVQTNLTLEEAVDIAFKVRRTEKFNWLKDRTQHSLSLDKFANKVINTFRKEALGPGTTPGALSVTPFTVVTVVRGAGVDPSVPTPEGGEVHRALDAMTTWHPTWRHDILPNLTKASLQTRTTAPSHVLYGNTRGRAVWFPGLFTKKTRELHSLACYHRNLVLISMQVESLGGLISKTAEQIRLGGIAISVTHRECARRAAGILGQLYGGAPSTYRSWSPRAHIEQNNLLMPLNEVRDYFNMPPVS